MTHRGLLYLVPLLGCAISGGCSGFSGRQHPIFDAARQGDRDKVRMLLDADPSILMARERVPPRGKSPFPAYTGWTPLHCAAAGGSVPVIDLLLDRGADVNFPNDVANGQRPLHLAAANGHAAAVARLLDRGADRDATLTTGGETALHLAARGHRATVVKVLLDHGVNPNVRSAEGETALHLAANPVGVGWQPPSSTGRADAAHDAARDTVAALLDHHADVSARDGPGFTPLLRCMEAGHPYPGQAEVAELLLAHGAAVNDAGGPAGWTPLHWAARIEAQPNGEEVALVKLLLAHGADSTARDANGRTPLDVARSPAVKELLAKARKPAG